MLRWRLILGTLIIAALVALCWLDAKSVVPGLWLLPVAAIVAVLSTSELLELAAAVGLRPLRRPVYFGNLLLVATGWLAMLERSSLIWGNTGYAWVFVVPSAFGVAVLWVFVGEMRRYERPGGNMANLATGVFALVYIGMTLCFAVQLRIVWGVGALATWVITVKMGDIGAYTVGRQIGRHKMAPLISPGKTVEGAVGALAFSCLGSWLAFHWLVPLTSPEWVARGPRWGWLAFGLLVGAAGVIGDLVESFLKRDAGRKDSSDWLPGFGGVLDILDSLLLSAPVAWFCWAFGLVGR